MCKVTNIVVRDCRTTAGNTTLSYTGAMYKSTNMLEDTTHVPCVFNWWNIRHETSNTIPSRLSTGLDSLDETLLPKAVSHKHIDRDGE